MVAYLEKTDGNAEFHEIIDFLTRSSIHYALTVIAGKPVSISEASIRSDLQFNDAAGIDVLSNQAIFDTIQLMGYEGDLNTLTFNKGLFSPQWKFLFHTIIHCLSSKSTSWDQIPTNIATAVICLATNQVYNFSKLIFDGMMRHLDAKKKFVMYPRFIPVFLTNQLKNVPVPLDHFPINALTTKVFSFMVKKEDEGAVLERPSETQPTPSSSHPSEDPIEPQPDPSLRPSSSNPIPDSIPEGSGGNHGGQSSSDRSLSGNEDGLTLQSVYDLCVSLCKQVTTQAAQIKDLKSQIKQLKKKAKPVISHHNAWIKSVSMKKRLARKKSLKKKLMQKESLLMILMIFIDDAMDLHGDNVAQDTGRTSIKTWLSLSGDTVVLEEKESAEKGVSTEDPVSTAQPKVSTDKPKVSTDKPKVSTDKDDEGTAEPKDGNSDESATPTMTSTPTPTVFGDDETIAQVLITMSQNKVKQKEKEKGVEIKDTKDTDRPRTKIERSILTLKPLPKIDPKAKGKKKIEEEDESDTESEDITEAEKKFKMLANDEEIARKVQEEWEAEENKKRLAEEEATMAAFTNEYDFIQARLNAIQDSLQYAAQRRFLAQQRSKAIRNKLPARNQLRNQMMTYLKHVKRENERFIPIGSVEDDKLIEKMNKKANGMDKEEVSKELESSKVEGPKENIRKRSGRRLKMKTPKRLEDGTEINMLAERRYPLTKHTLERMMDLRLTAVSDDDTVFDLLNLLGQQIDDFVRPEEVKRIFEWFSTHLASMVKSWLVQDQTVIGKDYLNLLIADSLLKTIWFINAPCYGNEALASPKANDIWMSHLAVWDHIWRIQGVLVLGFLLSEFHCFWCAVGSLIQECGMVACLEQPFVLFRLMWWHEDELEVRFLEVRF
ncbi:hypothetical protein Tco_1378600 [Tanacetum coccineum]